MRLGLSRQLKIDINSYDPPRSFCYAEKAMGSEFAIRLLKSVQL